MIKNLIIISISIIFILFFYIYFIKYFLTSKKQKFFFEALKDMDDLLKEKNQKYFLACGTALGIYRDGKFIEYDPDIDIGIFYEDLDIDLINSLNNSKLKIIRKLGNINDSYEITMKHKNGVKIDIFIFYKINEDYYYNASFYGNCSKTKEGYCKWGRHIRGLKEIIFNNEKFMIPKNIDEYLRDSYGDDYMIPKKFSYYDGVNGLYNKKLN